MGKRRASKEGSRGEGRDEGHYVGGFWSDWRKRRCGVMDVLQGRRVHGVGYGVVVWDCDVGLWDGDVGLK